MAKEVAGLIKVQIKGGAANPSPPVGPALGSKGINIMEFCKQFNARTQDKAGKILPVIITYLADPEVLRPVTVDEILVEQRLVLQVFHARPKIVFMRGEENRVHNPKIKRSEGTRLNSSHSDRSRMPSSA